jgi:serine/threonine protein kinase
MYTPGSKTTSNIATISVSNRLDINGFFFNLFNSDEFNALDICWSTGIFDQYIQIISSLTRSGRYGTVKIYSLTPELKYQIIKIGYQTIANCHIAVKTINVNDISNEKAIKQAEDELNMLYALENLITTYVNPHFVFVYDCFKCKAENQIYAFMEYAHGTFYDLLSERKIVNNELTCDVLLFQLLSAIHTFEYHHGGYHHDIKPDNILFLRSSDEGYCTYTIYGKTYYIRNCGITLLLSDFNVSNATITDSHKQLNYYMCPIQNTISTSEAVPKHTMTFQSTQLVKARESDLNDINTRKVTSGTFILDIINVIELFLSGNSCDQSTSQFKIKHNFNETFVSRLIKLRSEIPISSSEIYQKSISENSEIADFIYTGLFAINQMIDGKPDTTNRIIPDNFHKFYDAGLLIEHLFYRYTLEPMRFEADILDFEFKCSPAFFNTNPE